MRNILNLNQLFRRCFKIFLIASSDSPFFGGEKPFCAIIFNYYEDIIRNISVKFILNLDHKMLFKDISHLEL